MSSVVRAASMKPCIRSVAGHATEFLELRVAQPSLQVVFVPGNPGVIPFYHEYLHSLSKCFDGRASITGISHIGHTAKDWENGHHYSLEQQIDHKAEFLKERFQQSNLPLVLVGHSIGAYIILELLKQFPDKIHYAVGLYPFLKTNPKSLKQTVLKTVASSSAIRATLGFLASLLGRSPDWLHRNLVKAVLGSAWGPGAVDVTCSYLLQASVVRNFAYMGMTEFHQLNAEPDFQFLREHCAKICLLFGADDHWGPLSLLEQIRQEAPELKASVQEENISHDFCCSKFGSEWVASYTADVVQRDSLDYKH